MDSSSPRNSGVSFVLHTPLLEVDVVNIFLKLRELVTITRAVVIASYITLGLISLAFRREMVPPTRLEREREFNEKSVTLYGTCYR